MKWWCDHCLMADIWFVILRLTQTRSAFYQARKKYMAKWWYKTTTFVINEMLVCLLVGKVRSPLDILNYYLEKIKILSKYLITFFLFIDQVRCEYVFVIDLQTVIKWWGQCGNHDFDLYTLKLGLWPVKVEEDMVLMLHIVLPTLIAKFSNLNFRNDNKGINLFMYQIIKIEFNNSIMASFLIFIFS